MGRVGWGVRTRWGGWSRTALDEGLSRRLSSAMSCLSAFCFAAWLLFVAFHACAWLVYTWYAHPPAYAKLWGGEQSSSIPAPPLPFHQWPSARRPPLTGLAKVSIREQYRLCVIDIGHDNHSPLRHSVLRQPRLTKRVWGCSCLAAQCHPRAKTRAPLRVVFWSIVNQDLLPGLDLSCRLKKEGPRRDELLGTGHLLDTLTQAGVEAPLLWQLEKWGRCRRQRRPGIHCLP